MKTFKQILSEANKPNSITLKDLHPLTDQEKDHVERQMDLYMDRHGLSGVAAEQRIAAEIRNMRTARDSGK
jgi:hypothetical protein